MCFLLIWGCQHLVLARPCTCSSACSDPSRSSQLPNSFKPSGTVMDPQGDLRQFLQSTPLGGHQKLMSKSRFSMQSSSNFMESHWQTTPTKCNTVKFQVGTLSVFTEAHWKGHSNLMRTSAFVNEFHHLVLARPCTCSSACSDPSRSSQLPNSFKPSEKLCQLDGSPRGSVFAINPFGKSCAIDPVTYIFGAKLTPGLQENATFRCRGL